MNGCKLIELEQIVDEKDGVLSVAEGRKNIPFDIKRVYYIYGLGYPKAERGHHAHRSLEQILIAVNGSFKLMVDDGLAKNFYYLSDPNRGIYIGPKIWHTMFEFSNDCIILVLASALYDEKDYIRNYSEFLNFIKNDSFQ